MEGELKKEILGILNKYFSDVPMSQEKANALVDELADLVSRPTLYAPDASQNICIACGLPYSGDYKYHLPLCAKRR